MRQALAFYSYSKVVLFAELFGINSEYLLSSFHSDHNGVFTHLLPLEKSTRQSEVCRKHCRARRKISPHPVTEPVVYLGRNKFFPDLQCVHSTCKLCFSKSMKVSTENS